MRSRFLLIPLVAFALPGCQWLTRLDADRNLELAQLDDRACESRGYAWPGEAYVNCRRARADERQREQWLELQMSRQQHNPQAGIRPASPLEPYRPIREENFACDQVVRDGAPVVICGED